MIAVDTNILVYAHRSDSKWHITARARVRELAEGPVSWAIPWPCLHEFLSIVTRKYSPPTPIREAAAQINFWLESPTLKILGERSTHWETLQRILFESKATGGLVHDARIAAICEDHGATALWTLDRDFSKFRRLNIVNPLR